MHIIRTDMSKIWSSYPAASLPQSHPSETCIDACSPGLPCWVVAHQVLLILIYYVSTDQWDLGTSQLSCMPRLMHGFC